MVTIFGRTSRLANIFYFFFYSLAHQTHLFKCTDSIEMNECGTYLYYAVYAMCSAATQTRTRTRTSTNKEESSKRMYKAEDGKKCKMASNEKKTTHKLWLCSLFGCWNIKMDDTNPYRMCNIISIFFLCELICELCNRMAQTIFYRF